MAKKASSDATTTWISLSEAKKLVVTAYQAEDLAERLLVEWLGQAKVRWSSKLFEQTPVSDLAALRTESVTFLTANVAYRDGDAAFWRTGLEINWNENWSRERYVVGGARAYGIKVVREDVLALLPAEATATKKWVTEEVRRMKQAGEIPSTITELAGKLAQRMEKDRTVKKPVGAPHITNMLRSWRLWPIS